MKEKKNIERLFQEKFKDFEVIPPQEAWQNIEARLQDKKKKRRVFPIWLQPTGIAASIVIVLGVFNIFNNDNSFIENQDLNNINNNSVVNQSEIKSNNSNENTFPSTSKDKVNSNEGLNKIIEEGEIVTEQNKKESISKTKKLDIKSNSKNIFEKFTFLDEKMTL